MLTLFTLPYPTGVLAMLTIHPSIKTYGTNKSRLWQYLSMHPLFMVSIRSYSISVACASYSTFKECNHKCRAEKINCGGMGVWENGNGWAGGGGFWIFFRSPLKPFSGIALTPVHCKRKYASGGNRPVKEQNEGEQDTNNSMCNRP